MSHRASPLFQFVAWPYSATVVSTDTSSASVSSGSKDVDRGVRQRTRRAILDAAVSGWARDVGLSLGEIADGAEVSRSTLHRYFPDRQALMTAARDHAVAGIEAASMAATKDAATAAEILSGLIRAAVRMGDAVLFLYSDPNRFPDWATDDSVDRESLEIIERAQREGSVAPDFDPNWVLTTFYALAYSGAEMVANGTLSIERAGDLAARTLMRGVGADTSP